MTDRFSQLQHFLPPAHGHAESQGSAGPPEGPPRRPRSSFRVPKRVLQIATFAALLPVVSIAGGAGAARLALWEQGSATAGFSPAAAPVIRSRPDARPLDRPQPRAPKPAGHSRTQRKRRPKVVHRRFRFKPAQVTAALPPASAPQTSTAPVREHTRSKHKPGEANERTEKMQELPAPPGTPLFDCYSGEEVEHFITTDRASAAQTESSKGGYRCTIVGYVYAYPAPNTTEIEVDEGRAYVFTKRGAETKPSCNKDALYRHETGYDYWYSTQESDSGFVGYMKP